MSATTSSWRVRPTPHFGVYQRSEILGRAPVGSDETDADLLTGETAETHISERRVIEHAVVKEEITVRKEVTGRIPGVGTLSTDAAARTVVESAIINEDEYDIDLLGDVGATEGPGLIVIPVTMYRYDRTTSYDRPGTDRRESLRYGQRHGSGYHRDQGSGVDRELRQHLFLVVRLRVPRDGDRPPELADAMNRDSNDAAPSRTRPHGPSHAASRTAP